MAVKALTGLAPQTTITSACSKSGVAWKSKRPSV